MPFKLILLFVGFSYFITQNAYAEVDYGGSFRVRYENRSDFNLNDSSQSNFLTQLRLNLDWKIDDNNQFFIELQDARIIGEDRNDFPSINENANNQPFADNLDIHQFYYQRKWDGGKVKIGRQKFNLGDKRLVASLEWVNTARVHDAISLTLGSTKSREVNVFLSRPVSIDPNNFNSQGSSNNRYFDSAFHGVFVKDNSTLSGQQLEYWYFLRDNNDFQDRIHTFGARYMTNVASWKLDVQASIQTGDFNGLSHSASMFHGGISKAIDIGSIGFAYNYASGDGDSTDGEHKTFDNLYPLNHAYYGYMDFFSLQNIHNLEVEFKKPLGKAKLRIAYQGFWLDDTNDAWYNAGLLPNVPRRNAAIASSSSVDSYVGSEIDFTVKYPLTKKLVAVFGYSHFFSGDYTSDTGSSKNADFFFALATLNF